MRDRGSGEGDNQKGNAGLQGLCSLHHDTLPPGIHPSIGVAPAEGCCPSQRRYAASFSSNQPWPLEVTIIHPVEDHRRDKRPNHSSGMLSVEPLAHTQHIGGT
ncbi:unnamed protein product [Arctogadus glacialis]